ncbi:hypothetical protein N0V85_006150 [Neurospora sp. IMI 360204]|nr:hypothetical protein N0V85_006150 [Neurospora sp. IMI 360204]
MVKTYEEAECPGDTVPFLVDRLQFKYQAQLPGSSEGTYNFRVHHTPRPHAYRILRVRAGLPQDTLRFGAKPSTEPGLAYCCTITFTPISSIISWDLFPVVKPNNSCFGSVPHMVSTDSTIVNPMAIVDVSSTKEIDHGTDTAALQPSTITSPNAAVDVSSFVSGSYRKGKERETNINVHPTQASPTMTVIEYEPIIDYEPAPVAFGRIIWDWLMDVILRYLLDVISLHEAQRPGESETGWEREREPTVVVIAKDDDADKKFYASYGFVKSDEALEVSDKAIEGQFLRMVLKEGVIRALVKKRRAGEMDGEDIWTRRRREYEQMRIQAEDQILKQEILEEEILKLEILEEEILKLGIMKKEILKLEIMKEMLKKVILKQEILKNQILKQEILNESLFLLEDIPGNEQPEEIVEDTPGDGAKRTNSLPLRLHPKTYFETSEEQGGRRKRAKSRSVSATSLTGSKKRA